MSIPGIKGSMGGLAKLPPVLTYRGTANSSSGSSPVSFGLFSIGSASANRVVVACVGWGRAAGTNGSNNYVKSVTIGGLTATKVVGPNAGDARAEIWYAVVPTATSVSVDVAFQQSWHTRQVVFVYTITGATQTAPRTNTNNSAGATSVTGTIAINARQIGVAIGAVEATEAMNWTNATEDAEWQAGDSQSYAASHTTAAVASIAQSGTTSTTRRISIAVWG